MFFVLLFISATQMINPFLNSRISANHDKVEGLLANFNGEILIKRALFLYRKISFIMRHPNVCVVLPVVKVSQTLRIQGTGLLQTWHLLWQVVDS